MFKRTLLALALLGSLSFYRKIISKITGVTEASVAKLRLPTMSQKNVTFAAIAYIPHKLKSLGFIHSRVNLAPILFR